MNRRKSVESEALSKAESHVIRAKAAHLRLSEATEAVHTDTHPQLKDDWCVPERDLMQLTSTDFSAVLLAALRNPMPSFVT